MFFLACDKIDFGIREEGIRMKKGGKMLMAAAFLAAAGVSFWAGGALKVREYENVRAQRCRTILSFAVEKAESGELSEPDAAEALASNVYAASQICGDPDLSAQLHDLWNSLIFEGDSYAGREDELAARLKGIADMLP